jgi:hypothetical protein
MLDEQDRKHLDPYHGVIVWAIIMNIWALLDPWKKPIDDSDSISSQAPRFIFLKNVIGGARAVWYCRLIKYIIVVYVLWNNLSLVGFGRMLGLYLSILFCFGFAMLLLWSYVPHPFHRNREKGALTIALSVVMYALGVASVCILINAFEVRYGNASIAGLKFAVLLFAILEIFETILDHRMGSPLLPNLIALKRNLMTNEVAPAKAKIILDWALWGMSAGEVVQEDVNKYITLIEGVGRAMRLVIEKQKEMKKRCDNDESEQTVQDIQNGMNENDAIMADISVSLDCAEKLAKRIRRRARLLITSNAECERDIADVKKSMTDVTDQIKGVVIELKVNFTELGQSLAKRRKRGQAADIDVAGTIQIEG